VFDHVTIRVSDREASEVFYDTVLRALGIGWDEAGEEFSEWGDFSLATATEGFPVTRRLHIGFAAPSREHVDAFWRAGRKAGYRDDGEPGPRPEYREDYYGGFLLDPDGNSAEAVHHGAMRRGGVVDHLWIRVADVGAARRFYETVGPHAGFGLRPSDRPAFAHFGAGNGSFSVLEDGPATEHVHMAFAVDDRETMERFHRTAVAAGYRDNGAPGPRPQYSPRYHGAFVLDPDGNNIEVVYRS
jgi:catechol 2,3-dioxygenase-like lactoylglutathione lyase family enzyme